MTWTRVRLGRLRCHVDRSAVDVELKDGTRLEMASRRVRDDAEFQQAYIAMATRMADGLSVRLRIEGSRIVAVGRHDPRYHRTERALLDAFGVDIAPAIALARDAPIWSERSGGARRDPPLPLLIEHSGYVSCTVLTNDGFSLSSGQISLAAEIPDTIRAALTGEPVARLISHPTLDRFDLRIQGFQRTPGGIAVRYLDDEGWVREPDI